MPQKRLRIFAGPNGSGKSTLLRIIPESLPLGFYINPDDIEKAIASNKGINLEDYGVSPDEKALHSFFVNSDFVENKSDLAVLNGIFSIHAGVLVAAKTNIHPKYSAAILAEFLREENMKAGNDFSFETVMSHKNKIEFIQKAIKNGYHVYLYFICTDDVRVNIERVKMRVKEKGHSVPEEKIKNRYFRTLELLYDALKVCYKSYLFDNSDKTIEVARVNRDGNMIMSVKPELLPNWFIKYVIDKNISRVATKLNITFTPQAKK